MKGNLRGELEKRLKKVFSDYRELAGGKNFRYHHLTSSRDYAMKLVEHVDEDVDSDVLEIAALFHDIGRSRDIENGYLDPMEKHEGHAETGAEILDEHISDLVSEETLEKIETVIRNHHSEPETVEGKIVQDSDLLFKYGVHTLWRKIHYSAEKGEEPDDAIDYFYEREFDRLEKRRDKFHFDISRDVAERRLLDLKNAVRKMEIEMNGEDI